MTALPPGEDAMVAHAEEIRASQAMYADAQVGPADLTKLEPKDVAVPEPWPDEKKQQAVADAFEMESGVD